MTEHDDGTLYALLLCDPRALEATPIVAQAVASRLGQPLADVSVRIRYASGFVVRAADRGTVDDIGAALGAQGIETLALPEEDVSVPLRAIKITGCELADLTLTVQKGHSAVPLEIPWDTIGAMHAYALCEEFLEEQKREHMLLFADNESADEIDDDTKSQTTQRIYSEDAQKVIEAIADFEDKHKDREVQLFVDILTLRPRALYRVKRRDFNFAGLGDQRREHSMDNFLVLLRELTVRCDRALISLRTRRFLETLDFQDMLFEKEEELRNYDHWVLNLLVHRPDIVGIDPSSEPGDTEDDATTPSAPTPRPQQTERIERGPGAAPLATPAAVGTALADEDEPRDEAPAPPTAHAPEPTDAPTAADRLAGERTPPDASGSNPIAVVVTALLVLILLGGLAFAYMNYMQAQQDANPFERR